MSSIKVGISACLLGERVRYDGGHKLDRFLATTFGRYVQFVALCPEVACGFGTPREPMRLEGTREEVRLVTLETRRDVTPLMEGSVADLLAKLEKEGLSGFILKSRSPSCGLADVTIYNGEWVAKGAGIFARATTDHFPLVPAEDEEGMHDPEVRENFVRLMFTLRRWRDLRGAVRDRQRILGFHTRHKLLILSHDEKAYRVMGRLLARAEEYTVEDLHLNYERLLREALKMRATVKKHVNVLSHMMGYFKRILNTDEKREMSETIDAFRNGLLPLIAPITCINHHARKHAILYLREQVYLNPEPEEAMLLYHA